jgi:hypothetical protein
MRFVILAVFFGLFVLSDAEWRAFAAAAARENGKRIGTKIA